MTAQSVAFLLGVGAQKAGTTWLYWYLSQNSSVNFGFRKEYHIWDALYIENKTITSRWRQQRLEAVTQPSPDPRDLLLAKFLTEPSHYFAYFKTLAAAKHLTLTGDITPSYCGLSHEHFSFIRAQLKQAEMRPKVLLLLRDPVERCVSAARMELRRLGENLVLNREVETAYIREAYRSEEFNFRTRYDVTIENLEAAFAPEEVLILFYEQLFSVEIIEQLCNFLEIQPHKPDFSTRVNSSQSTAKIPDSLIAEIRDFYSPVYRYVSQKFGASKVKTLWKYA